MIVIRGCLLSRAASSSSNWWTTTRLAVSLCYGSLSSRPPPSRGPSAPSASPTASRRWQAFGPASCGASAGEFLPQLAWRWANFPITHFRNSQTSRNDSCNPRYAWNMVSIIPRKRIHPWYVYLLFVQKAFCCFLNIKKRFKVKRVKPNSENSFILCAGYFYIFRRALRADYSQVGWMSGLDDIGRVDVVDSSLRCLVHCDVRRFIDWGKLVMISIPQRENRVNGLVAISDSEERNNAIGWFKS